MQEDKLFRRLVEMRHLLLISFISAALTLFVEATPLMAGFSAGSRHNIFYAVAILAVVFMVFLAGAIVFLVTRDNNIPIIKELQLGESWVLLVKNMAAALLLVALLAVISVIGLGRTFPSVQFLRLYEWLTLTTSMLVGMCSYFFCLVLYKIRVYGKTKVV